MAPLTDIKQANQISPLVGEVSPRSESRDRNHSEYASIRKNKGKKEYPASTEDPRTNQKARDDIDRYV